MKRFVRRAVLPAILLAATALGGCLYPYPGYYGSPYYASAYPAYAAPVVVGGGFYGGYHRPRYWR